MLESLLWVAVGAIFSQNRFMLEHNYAGSRCLV